MKIIIKASIKHFCDELIAEERSAATVQRYEKEVRGFCEWLDGRACTREIVQDYKACLSGRRAPAGVNTALCAINRYFSFRGWQKLRVRTLKIQRRIYSSDEKELTRSEYQRLLDTAGKQHKGRLCLLMQSICSTGIRVSELRYITVEAVERGVAEVDCKGKRRKVFLPAELCKMLKAYCRSNRQKQGPVFVTKSGNPMDRSNIWSEMKKLCWAAGVDARKVFPHNLRHLFARTFYRVHKDIVRLADLLGHSSINTTRIYTMESGAEHRRRIQRLGLLRC